MEKILTNLRYKLRLKNELDILLKFYVISKVKIAVIKSENIIQVYRYNSSGFKMTEELTVLNEEDLFENLKALSESNSRNFLIKYLKDLNEKNEFIKINTSENIYFVYFSLKNKVDSLSLFKENLSYLFDDIINEENLKSELNKAKIEIKNLKKEKYITSSALDSIPGNIVILDKNAKIVYTNNYWEQFALKNGALPAKVGIEENYLEVAKKAAAEGDISSARAYNGILSVLNNEKDFFTMDYPCHSPEEKRWFRMCVSSFKGIGSYEIMILHQDITKEILAEKKSESLLNKLPAAIMKFDKNLNLNYFNQKASNLLDLIEKDYEKKINNLKVVEKNNENYYDKIKIVIKNREVLEFKIIIEKNNKKNYFDNYLVPEFEKEELKSVISIIPFQHKQDKKIKKKNKQKNHYLQLFENLPDALILLNLDEKIINANKAFVELFKYKISELKNKKLDNLIVPDDFKKEGESFSHQILKGNKIERVVKRMNSEGENLNLKLTAFPVLLNDNRIGIYAIYRTLN